MQCAAQLGRERHAAGEHELGGDGAVPGCRRPNDQSGVLETYVERVLAPSLRPAQAVVMDNLSSPKGPRVRELVEARGGELLYLPAYTRPISTP